MADARRVLKSLVQKELREVTRDGRFWLVALVIGALLMVSLAFGLRQSAALRAEREAAQATADHHFREQDEKNPHVAAHYGTYVFKPSGALPFIDPGVDPFVGASIKLQAHQRNAPEGVGAEDATSLARVGRLSVAAVLQLLMPLLVIGLGFAAWTAERERGTLRLLATSGTRMTTLFGGKLLGLGAALCLLLVPAVVLGALVMVVSGSGSAPVGRLSALLVSYGAYFAMFLALTLWVSARSASSRSALVALLGVWVLTALVLPRAVSEVAATVVPLPAPSEVSRNIRASLAEGLPGGPKREERIGAISDEMLEREGFQGAETLMDAALLGGIELQAEAQFENEVLDFHHRELDRAIAHQESFMAWLSLSAPPVAMQAISSGLAGTDGAHHRHFSEAAERHRRSLIEMLNREFAERAGNEAWSYKAGRETWERAPRFAYEQPPLAHVAMQQRTSLLVLGGWLLITLALAARAARRVEVV